jgi:hypothetical protein
MGNVAILTEGEPRWASLTSARNRLGLAVEATTDALLDELILEVSGELEGLVCRPLGRHRYRESAPGRGTVLLFLSRAPIESLLSVAFDGEELDLADEAIEIDGPSTIRRRAAWQNTAPLSDEGIVRRPVAGQELPLYSVEYWAGYLMPPQVVSWTAGAAVTAGAWVRPANRGNPLRFEADAAGATGDTEPTWPTSAGESVADNGITWTAYAAKELPAGLRRLALRLIVDAWHTRSRDRGLRRVAEMGTSREYHNPGGAGGGRTGGSPFDLAPREEEILCSEAALVGAA